jgi:diguanylate cyclase (GGDEF)-like protein/PAS domain S-box-containing protein
MPLFKRYLLSILVLPCLLLLDLGALSGESTTSPPIKVGLEQNPPLSFINEQGKADGILIDLLEYVAKQEGWQLEYVPNTFNNCLENLKNEEIDLMATIAYTKERAELYDFNSVNVIANWGQLYIQKSSAIQSYFDLAGKQIAIVSKDSHQQTFRAMLEQFGIKAHYLPVENFDAVFQLLADKQADAGVVGRFYALQNEGHYPDIKASPLIFNPIEVHYAAPKGKQHDLLASLDQHLKTLQADKSSFYYQSLERWLGLMGNRGLPPWIQIVALVATALLLILFIFNVTLRYRIKTRTRHLELEIQERGKAEEAARASEHKYRELVENANSIILRMNCDGTVAFFNEFAEHFFGFSQEEILGRHVIGTIVPARDSANQDLRQMIKQICHTPEAFIDNENENIRKDGKRVWISWSNKPLHNPAGELEGVLAIGQDITYRKRYEAQLLHQASHDALTNLPNRILLCDRVAQSIITAEKQKKGVAILLLDLDNFKIVNDTIGHSKGDLLLKAVSQRLQSVLGEVGTLARLGGDEFVILQDNFIDNKDTARLAEKIIKVFTDPFAIDGHEIFVSISMGIALYPNDGQTVEILLRFADVAMYHAKNQGKNNYQFFTHDINQYLHKRMEIENQLRRALERDEFQLYYQPQIDTDLRAISGMEALLRWQPADADLVYPADFISILEETGMIVPVGEWILRTACRQAKAWVDSGWPPFIMSINISARQFQQPDLDIKIVNILKETGFSPQLLCLELTESIIMQDSEEVIRKMHRLREMGIRLSIDDFGTGYSSLSYLQRMPINQLKIDRSFISSNLSAQHNNIIVDTILGMARCLNMETIAEGVETELQLNSLIGQNCKQIQGYYFSKPLPADAFTLAAQPGGPLRIQLKTLSAG